MSTKYMSKRIELERYGLDGSFRFRVNLSIEESVWLKHFSTLAKFAELTKNLDRPVSKLFAALDTARRAKDFFVDKEVEGDYSQEYLCHILGTDFNLSFWVRAEVWTGLDTLTQSLVKMEF